MQKETDNQNKRKRKLDKCNEKLKSFRDLKDRWIMLNRKFILALALG